MATDKTIGETEFCTCTVPTCKYRDTENRKWICEVCQKPIDETE